MCVGGLQQKEAGGVQERNKCAGKGKHSRCRAACVSGISPRCNLKGRPLFHLVGAPLSTKSLSRDVVATFLVPAKLTCPGIFADQE